VTQDADIKYHTVMKHLLITFAAISILAPALAGRSTNPQGNSVNGPKALLDYGDAPDSHATTKLNNRPSHRLTPGFDWAPTLTQDSTAFPRALSAAEPATALTKRTASVSPP
jgi:hypothetical protein